MNSQPGPIRQLLRLSGTLVVVGVGWFIAASTSHQPLTEASWYPWAAATLLAIGLYASTAGIELPLLRGHLGLIGRAVTIGVLAKAALIAGVMVLAFRDSEYLVLAVAVAQIDPLSVAAIGGRTSMTPRARTILSAWASFDDPVTALLTIYLSALVLSSPGSPGQSGVGGAASDFGVTLLVTLGLIVLAAAVRLLLGRGRGAAGPGRSVLESVALAGLLALAVAKFLMLGVALLGLLLRPPWLRPWLGRLTSAAFYLAALGLGLMLDGPVDPLAGVVLALAAVAAHGLVSLVLTIGLPWPDRGGLALGQQNGITAIVLALILEPALPGAVGTVAIAVLVVNALHVLTNAGFEAFVARRERSPRGAHLAEDFLPEPVQDLAQVRSVRVPEHPRDRIVPIKP
jgi:hypothetical protein